VTSKVEQSGSGWLRPGVGEGVISLNEPGCGYGQSHKITLTYTPTMEKFPNDLSLHFVMKKREEVKRKKADETAMLCVLRADFYTAFKNPNDLERVEVYAADKPRDIHEQVLAELFTLGLATFVKVGKKEEDGTVAYTSIESPGIIHYMPDFAYCYIVDFGEK